MQKNYLMITYMYLKTRRRFLSNLHGNITELFKLININDKDDMLSYIFTKVYLLIISIKYVMIEIETAA